jgi:hypothetical protein
MGRTRSGASATCALITSLIVGCSGSGGTEFGSNDDGGEDATAECGSLGAHCCNGTACNAGLTCTNTTCVGSSENDATAGTDASTPSDATSNADHEVAFDAAGDAPEDVDSGDDGDGGGGSADGGQDAALVDGAVADASGDSAPDTGFVDSGIADAGNASDACVDTCTVGATECVSNGVSTCVEGASGCAAWGSPATCGTHQICSAESDGGAACTCLATTPCTLAGATCEGSSTLDTCAVDSDGCFFVSASKTCDPTDEECTGSPGSAACNCVADPNCSTASPYCVNSSTLTTCAPDSNGCVVHTNKTYPFVESRP